MSETASESLCKSKDVCNDVKEYIIEEEDEAATMILTERLQERSLHMQSIGIKFFKTKIFAQMVMQNLLNTDCTEKAVILNKIKYHTTNNRT